MADKTYKIATEDTVENTQNDHTPDIIVDVEEEEPASKQVALIEEMIRKRRNFDDTNIPKAPDQWAAHIALAPGWLPPSEIIGDRGVVIPIVVTNIGFGTWLKDDEYTLNSKHANGFGSVIYRSSVINTQNDIYLGEKATIQYYILAPETIGTYEVQFYVKSKSKDGGIVNWINGKLNFNLIVTHNKLQENQSALPAPSEPPKLLPSKIDPKSPELKRDTMVFATIQEWRGKFARAKKELKEEHILTILISLMPAGERVAKAKMLSSYVPNLSLKMADEVIDKSKIPSITVPKMLTHIIMKKSSGGHKRKMDALRKNEEVSKDVAKVFKQQRDTVFEAYQDLNEELLKSYHDFVNLLTGTSQVLNFVENQIKKVLDTIQLYPDEEEMFQFLNRTLRNEIERTENMETHARKWVSDNKKKYENITIGDLLTMRKNNGK